MLGTNVMFTQCSVENGILGVQGMAQRMSILMYARNAFRGYVY